VARKFNSLHAAGAPLPDPAEFTLCRTTQGDRASIQVGSAFQDVTIQ